MFMRSSGFPGLGKIKNQGNANPSHMGSLLKELVIRNKGAVLGLNELAVLSWFVECNHVFWWFPTNIHYGSSELP